MNCQWVFPACLGIDFGIKNNLTAKAIFSLFMFVTWVRYCLVQQGYISLFTISFTFILVWASQWGHLCGSLVNSYKDKHWDISWILSGRYLGCPTYLAYIKGHYGWIYFSLRFKCLDRCNDRSLNIRLCFFMVCLICQLGWRMLLKTEPSACGLKSRPRVLRFSFPYFGST